MSQGDTSEQRAKDALAELADYAETAEQGMGSVRADDCRAEVLGELERLVAEVVGLREQLAAAEATILNAGEGAKNLLARAKAAERERDTLRAVERVIHKHRKRAEVAVGRLEKAQAALREISLILGDWVKTGSHTQEWQFFINQLYDALGDALGNMTPEEKQ